MGDAFLAFVEPVLGPRLEPGQVVILDNLSAHKVEPVPAHRKPRCGRCASHPFRQAAAELQEILGHKGQKHAPVPAVQGWSLRLAEVGRVAAAEACVLSLVILPNQVSRSDLR